MNRAKAYDRLAKANLRLMEAFAKGIPRDLQRAGGDHFLRVPFSGEEQAPSRIAVGARYNAWLAGSTAAKVGAPKYKQHLRTLGEGLGAVAEAAGYKGGPVSDQVRQAAQTTQREGASGGRQRFAKEPYLHFMEGETPRRNTI